MMVRFPPSARLAHGCGQREPPSDSLLLCGEINSASNRRGRLPLRFVTPQGGMGGRNWQTPYTGTTPDKTNSGSYMRGPCRLDVGNRNAIRFQQGAALQADGRSGYWVFRNPASRTEWQQMPMKQGRLLAFSLSRRCKQMVCLSLCFSSVPNGVPSIRGHC